MSRFFEWTEFFDLFGNPKFVIPNPGSSFQIQVRHSKLDLESRSVLLIITFKTIAYVSKVVQESGFPPASVSENNKLSQASSFQRKLESREVADIAGVTGFHLSME